MGFIRWLRRLFHKPPKWRDGAKIYEIGGGWGDAINWFDWKQLKVVGWKTPRPKEGDELRSKMQSGGTVRFVLVNIKYERDPADMFFAQAVPVCWMDGRPVD